MDVGHKYCISIELPIHIDVKYHVHIGVLISRSNFYFHCLVRFDAVKFLKYYTDIYFAIALVQNSVPYCLSISYSSFTVLGTSIPNLYDVRQHLDLSWK